MQPTELPPLPTPKELCLTCGKVQEVRDEIRGTLINVVCCVCGTIVGITTSTMRTTKMSGEPTPEDLAIRTAVEVLYRLRTAWPSKIAQCVVFRHTDPLGKSGIGINGTAATRDWCEKNNVEWRLPE